ncbi:hypothetical protein PLESTM_000131800 [Pleodorina starrii]|nr:hypothetical protein PLESTM_000131800 [Pleodorina starrii]
MGPTEPLESSMTSSAAAPRQERAVVVSRGVYQQPFRFKSLPWRVLGSIISFPAWLLEAVMPIMMPDNPLRKCWTFWTLALVLYVAIDVPLQIAFTGWIKMPGIQALSLLTSASFCLDVVVHFRTAYITSQGDLIRVPYLIALHYLRGMFLLDLVSALPMDELLAGTSFRNDAVWLGLLKLPRLFRLVRHVNALTRTKYVNLVGAARLLGVMFLITHWAACLWHYMAREIPSWPWIFSMQCRGCSDSEEYVFAFYQCFLLMLGDRPDTYNNVERVFAVILLSMGACLYAVVVSSITMLVTNMWSMASRHKQRSSMLQDALRYKGASSRMRIRVDEYYNFMARFDHPGPDGVSLLNELPAALHAEVLSSVFERMLVKVQLFAYCERPFLWRLAQKLRLSLFMPGDTIYDVGSVGHDMYIIWKGAVGLTAPDGCMAALLCDNDHFGELGIMNISTPRPHRAVALRQCDVMILSLWDLQDAMRDFPDSAQLVKGRARVQLEDHEAGPAVWAASLATGQTPRHELHPTFRKPTIDSSSQVPGVDESTSRPLQRGPTGGSSGSDSDAGRRDGGHGRGSSGAGAGGGGPARVPAAMSLLRGMSLRLRMSWKGPRRWRTSDAGRGAGASSEPGGDGGGGGHWQRPIAEAMERGGGGFTAPGSVASEASASEAASRQASGAPLSDMVTALSRPGSPQSCSSSCRKPPVSCRDGRPVTKLEEGAAIHGTAPMDANPRDTRPQTNKSRMQQQLQYGSLYDPHHANLYQQQQQQLPGSLVVDQLSSDSRQQGRRRLREEVPAVLPSGITTRAHHRATFSGDLSLLVVRRNVGGEGSVHSDASVRYCRSGGDGSARGHHRAGGDESVRGRGPGGNGFVPGCITGGDGSVRGYKGDGSVRGYRAGGNGSVPGCRSGEDISVRSCRAGGGGDSSVRGYRAGGDGSVHGCRSGGDTGRSAHEYTSAGDGSVRGYRAKGDGSVRGYRTNGDGSVHGNRSGGDGSVRGFRANGGDGSVHGGAAAGRGNAAARGAPANTRSQTRSSDGLEVMREDTLRDVDADVRAPDLLVLQAQPFLGLDPLGPLFDDVAKAAASAAAAEQQRRRMRAGYQATGTATGAEAHLGTTPFSPAAGDHDTTRELVRPVGVWDVNRKVRRSSLRVGVSGLANSRWTRLTSDSGAGCGAGGGGGAGRVRERERERAVEGWLEEHAAGRDARCAALEKQLKEAQRQLLLVFENPLKVPAFAAALRLEVEAVTTKLNTQMLAQLKKLQAMLHTMAGRTEDLAQQVSAAEERFARIEEEKHVTFQTSTSAVAAVMAASMSNAGGGGGAAAAGPLGMESPLDGREGADALVTSPLGLLGPHGAPPPVLLPLSTANVNASGRSSVDASRFQLGRQPSMRHTRRLSALDYGTLPDSEPLIDGGAAPPVVAVAAAAAGGAGGSGPDGQLAQAMTPEDAVLLAATVQRAVGSTSRRRRSALELSLMSYSSLVAAAAAAAGQQALQQQPQTQPSATRSESAGQRVETTDQDAGGGPGGSGEPSADQLSPLPLMGLRIASMRRNGRRGSWAQLAGAMEGAGSGAAGGDFCSSGSGGAGGSVRMGVQGGSSLAAEQRPGEVAEGHSIRQKTAPTASRARPRDSPDGGGDGGGGGGGSGSGIGGAAGGEIYAVGAQASSPPPQLPLEGATLERSSSSSCSIGAGERRSGSVTGFFGGGEIGIGSGAVTGAVIGAGADRGWPFRRSGSSSLLAKEGPQQSGQSCGGSRMGTISELEAFASPRADHGE